MLRACSFWCSIAIFWKHQTVLSETTTEKTHTQTQVSNSLSFEYIHEPNGRWFVIYSMRFHIDRVQHNIAHEKNFKWLLLKMGVRQFKHLTKWMWQFCCDFEFNRDRIGDDLIVCYCSLQAYRNINWFHNITRRSFVWFTWLKVCTTGWQQKENDIYTFYRHFVLSKNPRYVEHFCSHQSHSHRWIAYFALKLRFNIELQKHPIDHKVSSSSSA